MMCGLRTRPLADGDPHIFWIGRLTADPLHKKMYIFVEFSGGENFNGNFTKIYSVITRWHGSARVF